MTVPIYLVPIYFSTDYAKLFQITRCRCLTLFVFPWVFRTLGIRPKGSRSNCSHIFDIVASRVLWRGDP